MKMKTLLTGAFVLSGLFAKAQQPVTADTSRTSVVAKDSIVPVEGTFQSYVSKLEELGFTIKDSGDIDSKWKFIIAQQYRADGTSITVTENLYSVGQLKNPETAPHYFNAKSKVKVDNMRSSCDDCPSYETLYVLDGRNGEPKVVVTENVGAQHVRRELPYIDAVNAELKEIVKDPNGFRKTLKIN